MIAAWLAKPAIKYGLVALLAFGAGVWIRGTFADATEARMASAHAKSVEEWATAANKALTEAAQRSQTRIDSLEKAVGESKARTEVAEKARAALASDASSLRKRIGEISSSIRSADPSIASGSKAGTSGIDLLAYMSGKLIERASELARIADESRNRGLTCEAAYYSLIASNKSVQ